MMLYQQVLLVGFIHKSGMQLTYVAPVVCTMNKISVNQLLH